VRVFDAGHMVPMDQPVAALDMLDRFIQQISYADSDAVAAGPTVLLPAFTEERTAAVQKGALLPRPVFADRRLTIQAGNEWIGKWPIKSHLRTKP
jgi:hypothetical protein